MASRLAAVALALVLLGAGGVPVVEQVGGTRVAIVVPDTDPAGSVILVPGGTTLLTIHPDGSSGSLNFVMVIRGRLVSDGFAIAYTENPGDLRALVARMRVVKRPVFLLATSDGSAVAARNAAVLGADGPDGLILTSTVTKTSLQFRSFNAALVDVGKITVPVLFVENTNDSCSGSPPSGIAPLMARFPKGSDVTRIDVTSATTGQDPCGPIAAHGYLGIEHDVTDQIVAWMHAHGAS